MIAFEVNDMTCGHCVGTITKAVKAIDANAQVNIDLAKHRVEIESTVVGSSQMEDAISAAGYTPLPATGAFPAERPSVARGGCCC